MAEMVDLNNNLCFKTTNLDSNPIVSHRIICKLDTNRAVRAIYEDKQQ